MISIERQQNLLLNVSRRLKKPITVYAIGGTAMMFLGMKEATLDIGLVFENEKDKIVFKKAIESLGYSKMDSFLVYGTRKNQPEMFKLDDERFDLFVYDIIDFIFSENMKKRADKKYQFNQNLLLKIANPHDIILMKCATDRLKDKDDARNIINNIPIDWNILINEAKNQIKLGKERAIWELGCFLEELKNKMKVKIPQKIINELSKLMVKQAKQKQK